MKTFIEVGIANELEDRMLERYVQYMLTRWKEEEEIQCQTGYASEWAQRFKTGIEYGASDLEGQRVLKEMDKIKEKIKYIIRKNKRIEKLYS